MKKVLLLALIVCNSALASPLDALLDRIGGKGTSGRIITRVVTGGHDTKQEWFEITSERDKPLIEGSSYIAVATGVNWYLKYYAGVMLSWNALTADLSKTKFPVPSVPERHSTDVIHRYYLNYCTYSYSMAFWDWERWEKEIDWMALHGINMPLAATGIDVAWRNVLVKRLGYTPEEANKFVGGAGFQAWFLMGNLEGWGGPNPDSYYERQEMLQKQILARMRELDMEPVLPGFAGLVPHDINVKKGWTVTEQGIWCGFQRPAFMQPENEHFAEMAKYYYEELRNLYGVSRYYSMDPFHEGGSVEGVDLKAAYKAVYKATEEYSGSQVSPQWVVQSWQGNPRQEAFDALEPGKLLVLDLFADGVDEWRRTKSYSRTDGRKHETVFCIVHNFGGRTGLVGRIEHVANEYYAARKEYPQTMRGIGTTMEAIENNPVAYESFYELPWRETLQPASEWIKGYVKARYGCDDENLGQAWQLLLQSVYNLPYKQQGPTESVFCARPSLAVERASSWGTAVIYWNPEDVRKAAALMLEAARKPKKFSPLALVNLKYDLVDLVRQTLDDKANALIKEIKIAYDAGKTQTFSELSDTFLELILLQDTLLGTIPDFMLGRWLNAARNMGTAVAERNLYEFNARVQITTWGPEAAANDGKLHDYSCREWNGLLRDFYYPRWKLFFDCLKAGKPTPTAQEFFNFEYKWANTPANDAVPKYSAVPQGDALKIAERIYRKMTSEY